MTIRNVRANYCNFCGKSNLHEDVERIISGPGADICDKCVDICVEVIKKERQKEKNAIAT